MSISKPVKLVVSLVVPAAAGTFGAAFTEPAITSGWYAALAKPAFTPPSAVFGPVWSALYILTGVSLFLVWKQHSNILQNVGMLRTWRTAMGLFFIQLSLNAAWSVIFFGMQNPGWALIDIVVLWVAIAATVAAFAKVSKPAAYLLVPYFAWVSFAAYLNLAIWILN